MRFKKLIPLLFTSLALSSCGNSNPYVGTYSFQMGKDDGTHMGISMELTDEDHNASKPELGKTFEITIKASMFETFSGEDVKIAGGYTIGDQLTKDAKLVNLNYDFLTDSWTLLSALLGVEVAADQTGDYLQKLITTSVTKKAFNLIIPVSMNDLALQLYWYGIDINHKSGEAKCTPEAHPLHSHPTKEQIEEISKTYNGHHTDDNGDDLDFRDFYTITIGLSKKKQFMEDNREVVIEVEHLTKDYGYGRGVFDVSIKVHKGECYGYLGPNGAGKSTTIRHIMGFSKPTVGKTCIFGKDTFGHTQEILGKVGYLPGEPAIPAGLDGWGFLRMMQDMRGERNDEYLNYLLKTFAFNPHVPVKSMSLGEKRKLAVVAAFMNDPDVLILDEPTSGLDPLMQKVFIAFIVEQKKRGKTILLSSHIFSEVDATCDTISIIKDGIHVSTFKADELKNMDYLTYNLRFVDQENYDKFLKGKHPCEIVEKHDMRKIATCKVKKEDYEPFFKSLAGIKVEEFEEKPFTLQDYFMSFYKEEKEFTGLAGVKGNKK